MFVFALTLSYCPLRYYSNFASGSHAVFTLAIAVFYKLLYPFLMLLFSPCMRRNLPLCPLPTPQSSDLEEGCEVPAKLGMSVVAVHFRTRW